MKQLAKHLPTTTNLVVTTLGTLLVGVLTNEMDDNPAKRVLGGYYLPAVGAAALVCVFVAPPLVERWRARRAARRGVAHTSRAPVRYFFERREYTARLLEALRPRDDRAVVALVWGMSDVGKTQLALHAVRHPEVAAAYPEGPLMLDLHGIDPEEHPREIGNALRELLSKLAVDPARYGNSDLTDLFDIYRSELRGRRLLLLLDNLDEHIGKWKDLICEEAARCAFLVTSRTNLPLSDDVRAVHLEPLARREAAAFFAHVARARGRPLKLPAGLIDEICRLCGYLPLTIDMAVGALFNYDPARPPSDFVAELAREFDRALLLGGGDVETKTAIALSYQLLPPEERRTLLLLNLFQSPFDAEAEAAVAEDPGSARLRRLVRHSLVLFSEQTRRHRLHKLVRDYTAPRLTPDERRRAAARYAWHARRRIREATRLDPAAPASTAHLEAALRACDDLSDGSRIELPVLRAVCLTYVAHTNFDNGRFRQAITFGERAIELAAAKGLRRAEALARLWVGNSLVNVGEYHAAVEAFQRALALAREKGMREAEIKSLSGLASAYSNLSEHDEALEYYGQAAPIADELGLTTEYIECVGGMSAIFNNRGEYERAIKLLLPALDAVREAGDRRTESQFLSHLGCMYLNLRQTDTAIGYLQQAMETGRAHQQPLSRAMNYRQLGEAHCVKGDLARATYYLRLALDIADEIGNQALKGFVLFQLGHVAKDNNPLAAALYYKHALGVAEQYDLAELSGDICYDLSFQYVRAGNVPAALAQARKALAAYQRIDLDSNLAAAHNIERCHRLIEDLEGHAGRARDSNPAAVLDFVGGDEIDPEGLAWRRPRAEVEAEIRGCEGSLDHFRQVGSEDGEGGVEVKLSMLYGELGDWQAALEHAGRAEAIYEQLEAERPTPEVRDNLTLARLQAALATVELAPPPAADEAEEVI